MTLESMGKACGVAVLRWSIVYLVVAHIFVCWKWDSYSVSPRSRIALDQRKIEHNKTEQEARRKRETAAWLQIVTATRSSVEATQADLRKIHDKQAQLDARLQKLSRSLEHISTKQKELQALEGELTDLPMNKELHFFQDGRVSPDKYFTQVDELLRTADLAEISDTDDLRVAFTSATESMKKFLHEAQGEPRWAAVNDLLRQSYPPKRSQVSSCPDIPEEKQDEEAENIESNEPEVDILEGPILTKADVDALLGEIRTARDSLYEKDRPLLVSDDEMKRLENVRQKMTGEWMQRVQQALDEALENVELALVSAQEHATDQAGRDEDHKDANCAGKADVLEVLEAGIEALYRKQDMQEALRLAMIDADPSLKDVILDADLPLGENLPQVSLPVTLRQYLDTEILVHDVPGWIHALVDAVGGHSDAIDNFVDTLPDNCGEAFVQEVLDLAGTVNLSNIQGKLETYIADATK